MKIKDVLEKEKGDLASKVLGKVFPVVVLVGLGVNIYSIHKFKYTVVSFWHIFVTMGIGALLLFPFVLLVVILADREKWKSRILISLAASGAFYLLFFSFTTYFINRWSSSEATTVVLTELYSEESITYMNEDDDDEDAVITYDYTFRLHGYEFTKNASSPYYTTVKVRYRSGWLGWEYIEEMTLR